MNDAIDSTTELISASKRGLARMREMQSMLSDALADGGVVSMLGLECLADDINRLDCAILTTEAPEAED